MRSNRIKYFFCKLTILPVILLLLGASICFANDPNDPSTKDFKPDKQLLRKFAAMPYSGVVDELKKMPQREQLEYSLMLASVQLFSFKNTASAMQYCEHALAVSKEDDLPKGRVFLLEGYIYSSTNSIPETIAALKMASDCFRKEKDVELLKSCLSYLGTECYNFGNFEESQRAYEELLTICSDTEDEPTKAQTLFDIGEVYCRVLKLPQAKDAAEQAKAIFIKTDNQKGLADCLKLLGNIYYAEGKNDKAKEYYLQASNAYGETNESHGQGNCNFNLGLISIDLTNYSEAETYLNKAIYFYTDAGSIGGAGIAHMELGRTYILQGNYEKAESALKQAETFLTGDSDYRLAQTKDYLGNLEKARNHIQQSLRYYEASVELYHGINLKADEARVKKKIEALKNN